MVALSAQGGFQDFIPKGEERRRDDASSPPQPRSRLRSIRPLRRSEQPPQRRRSVAKTRGDLSDVAASRRRSAQRREDARRTQRRGSVAASRSREETPAAWQRRSVTASRQREDESSPLSGVTVITESLSCIFENQNANALPSFLHFLAKFSLTTPAAMPSDFPEAKNLLVLQSSSSSKILL